VPNVAAMYASLAVVASLVVPGPAGPVADYWTPERMREAIHNSGDEASAPVAQVAAHRRAGPAAAQLPGMKAIGRVFATKPDGTGWSCSGTLVDSRNRSVVWTAGHCIHPGRGGAFYTNLAFAPGYRPQSTGNPAPYGIWPAAASAATGSWTRRGVSRNGSRKVWKTAAFRNTSASVCARAGRCG
jgi:hypothetical protein